MGRPPFKSMYQLKKNVGRESELRRSQVPFVGDRALKESRILHLTNRFRKDALDQTL